MNREDCLNTANHYALKMWDVIIIGGGATGLGAAVDAASRGYKTLLLEQNDFAKSTSSRSTKLSHGGVRYLSQGNFKLVREALYERALMLQNAPHLASAMQFIVPAFQWYDLPFYGAGLGLYDLLSGKFTLGGCDFLSKAGVTQRLPGLKSKGLCGGITYFDGQFDDSRYAIALARTFVDDLGGTAINYLQVQRFIQRNQKTVGVVAEDLETGTTLEFVGKVVINATGIFTDQIRQLDDKSSQPILSVSQGAHVVIDLKYLFGESHATQSHALSALMIPKTSDGRVLFGIPWHGKLIVGTTDVPVAHPQLEPRYHDQEIEFLLGHLGHYLKTPITLNEVESVFVGQRPLIAKRSNAATKSLSREHVLFASPSQLITIAGGKWTTYRKMGQQTIDLAARIGNLPSVPSQTESLKLHGWCAPAQTLSQFRKPFNPMDLYGSDRQKVEALILENSQWNDPIHPALPYRQCDIIWAIRQEMARTVEDILARRTRALFLNAKAAIQSANQVAKIMAEELSIPDRSKQIWEAQQVAHFQHSAVNYQL